MLPFLLIKNTEQQLRIFVYISAVFFFDDLVDIFILILIIILFNSSELLSESFCFSSMVKHLGEIPPGEIDQENGNSEIHIPIIEWEYCSEECEQFVALG